MTSSYFSDTQVSVLTGLRELEALGEVNLVALNCNRKLKYNYGKIFVGGPHE